MTLQGTAWFARFFRQFWGIVRDQIFRLGDTSRGRHEVASGLKVWYGSTGHGFGICCGPSRGRRALKVRPAVWLKHGSQSASDERKLNLQNGTVTLWRKGL